MRVRIGPVDCERFNWSDTTGIDLFTNLPSHWIERDTRRVYLFSNINMGKQLLYITCVYGKKWKKSERDRRLPSYTTRTYGVSDNGGSGAHFEKLLYCTWNIIIYILPASANRKM